MQVSVELTMSPLQDNFESHVIDFIKVLRASDFTILENPLSTQIYGDYDQVMPFLTRIMGESMAAQDAVLVYMKIVKTDRSDYKPHF